MAKSTFLGKTRVNLGSIPNLGPSVLRSRASEELLLGEEELEAGVGEPGAKAEKGREMALTRGQVPLLPRPASPAGAARRRLQVVLSPCSNRVGKVGCGPASCRENCP